jgi:multidrug efflux pump subunit AcrA (membrane-fusion protein)
MKLNLIAPLVALLLLALLGALSLGCGEAAAGGEPAPSPAAGEPKVLFYRHPMHPAVTSPVPAKDEMGMDYVPEYVDEVGADEVGAAEAGAAESQVPGLATVQVGSRGLRLAGVQTAGAAREVLRRSIRTVGLVTPDERRIRHVHTKISGWVEELYVNYTGQAVKAGQPLLDIYSPQVLASQEELLRARQTAVAFAGSSLPEVRQGGLDLLAAARRRLELFDVPASFLAELERTGVPRRTVTLLAPVSGYVTGKQIFEGQQVEPGFELLTITDLSWVWIEADFYEFEARSLAVGQQATLFFPYDPHVRLAGRVSFIYPTLDAESRTLKVRLEFPNRDASLKPGMFAEVRVALTPQEGVVVPDSAVIDSGMRQIVFVEREAGSFEPREVKVGGRSDGKALILAGVEEAERVAIKANFLLDSESRLRAALLGMKGAGSQEHDGGGR